MCAAIRAFGERSLTRKRWLALYFAGAIAGHAIGEAFQPLEGGKSVAFVGILGGLAATRWSAAPRLANFRIQAAVAIPLAVLDTALGDIHGLPLPVGFALGTACTIRDGAALPVALSHARLSPRRS